MSVKKGFSLGLIVISDEISKWRVFDILIKRKVLFHLILLTTYFSILFEFSIILFSMFLKEKKKVIFSLIAFIAYGKEN